MEESKLPYKVEYAKSGRAGCKSCKEPISKDSLRLAVMVQSPFFDGMQPNWHHFSCFFKKFRPKTTADISHFESIRWEDQETIRKKIENIFNTTSSAEDISKKSKSSKSKKRSNNNAEVLGLADYTIQYSKSKRAKCKVCGETIEKDVIRISKKDYESEVAMKYGPVETWHHVDCFVGIREQLEFFASGEVLPGFHLLIPEDKNIIKSKIPEIIRPNNSDNSCDPSPPKKIKKNENENENKLINKKLKKQNDIMFKYHDFLKVLKTSELKLLLEFNNQEVPEGSSRMIERLSDLMTFGALKKCEKCKGQLVFSSGQGYVCKGYVNEWLKCDEVLKNPVKIPFQVPVELKEKYPFLKSYKGKVLERLFNENQITKIKPKANDIFKALLLHSLKFFIYKIDKKNSEELKAKIIKLGGLVVENYENDILAIISTSVEVKNIKSSKTLKSAQKAGIPVLSKTFFDELTNSLSKENLINKINEEKISIWDSNVDKKIKEKQNLIEKKSIYSIKENKSTFTVKDGLVVDPDSELDKIAHVYRKNNNIYNSVLSLVDVQSGKNSYYKIQILESDKKNKYWLFRSWGRIGTTIGGSKCEEYETLEDCIEMFKKIFEEQTGNKWDKRKNFKKVPGKKIMLDVDYKESKKNKLKSMPLLESKILSKSIQDLITLIFDVEAMKNAMLEFEIDLNKMPLGKLSRKQIDKAFGILSDVRNLIIEKGAKQLIIEKTNIFYSLVPHDFGINTPPLLDDEEIIKEKIEMLNSLIDINIAYNMLEDSSVQNSIDKQYEKLNTEIIDLDENSKEYKDISLYLKNTHAETHRNFSLEIENIFIIKRKGEDERYEKFSKFTNRKLLWHGSRVTNFAGILSQGLRIAPPEAPSTGYMFGKGIYFADMVSKSANYCCATKSSNTRLLLLCEVALGNTLDLTEAKYIEKLPRGKNSVKGMGQTHPDPAKIAFSPTGAELPIGEGIKAKIEKSDLMYNEYIVYNVDQVKIQYLLKVKFHFND